MNDKISHGSDGHWVSGDKLPPPPPPSLRPPYPLRSPLPVDTDRVMIAEHETDLGSVPIDEAKAHEEVFPRPLGDYDLLDVIERGGMGVVYTARSRGAVQRIVAIKVIRPDISGRELLARFKTECQSLAIMNHPNIATIFEVNTSETGEPYLVMERVEGKNLAAHCLTELLTLTEKLRLFTQICAGVQHAHQKQILHRDLKPDNVLISRVDGQDVPKLIDFGLAKVDIPIRSEATSHTKLGQILGTLHYMSPEGATLKPDSLDTRSDIFSLGVILFEMLTGSTPLDTKISSKLPIDERLRQVRNQEPIRPSVRCSNKLLRGDLDAICCKALATDPADRYESVSALASDIQRFLSSQAVSATPITTTYLLSKFARRNSKLLVGLTIAGAMLLALTGASITWALRASRAETRAGTQLALALEAKEAERAALRDAELERETALRINHFLRQDLLAQASPSINPGRDLTIRQVVDQAAISVKDRFTDQPAVQGELMMTVAEIYMDLGEIEKSLTFWREGYQILSESLGDEHYKTLNANQGLAQNCRLLGLWREAEQRMRSNFDFFRNAGDEFLDERRSVQNDLAVVLHNLGRNQEGSELLVSLIQESDPTSDDEWGSFATYKSNLAVNYLSQTRYLEALPLIQDAYQISARIRGLDHPATIIQRANYADVLMKMGDSQMALEEFKELRTCTINSLGHDHYTTVSVLENMAECLRRSGKLEEAEALIRSTISQAETNSAGINPGVITQTNVLAKILKDQGRDQEAKLLLVSQAEAIIADRTIDDRMSIKALSQAASHLNNQKEYSAARELINRHWRYVDESFDLPPSIEEFLLVRNWLQAIKGLDNWDMLAEAGEQLLGCVTDDTSNGRKEIAWLQYQTGYAYYQLKRYDQASELLLRSYEASLELQGPFYYATLDSQIMLGRACTKLGQPDRAADLYRNVIVIHAQGLDLESNRCQSAIRFLNDIAESLRDEERFDAAFDIHHFLTAFCKENLGDAHPETLTSLNGLGRTQTESGLDEDAASTYRSAIQRAGPLGPDNKTKHAMILYNWGLVENRLRNWVEAVNVWERAGEVFDQAYGKNYFRGERARFYQGEALFELGELETASRLLERIATIDESSDHRNYKYKIDTNSLLIKMADSADCERHADRVARIFEVSKSFARMDIWQRTKLASLAAAAYQKSGDLDRALKLIQQCRDQRQAESLTDYRTGNAIRDLGIIQFAMGDIQNAEFAWSQAFAIFTNDASGLRSKQRTINKMIDQIVQLYLDREFVDDAHRWQAKRISDQAGS